MRESARLCMSGIDHIQESKRRCSVTPSVICCPRPTVLLRLFFSSGHGRLQEQLRFDTRLSLLEFLEKDVKAVFAVARAGEEAAVDVKGTRAAWARA